MSYLALAFNPEDIERVLASMYTEVNILMAALIVALVVTVGLIFVKALKPLENGTELFCQQKIRNSFLFQRALLMAL